MVFVGSSARRRFVDELESSAVERILLPTTKISSDLVTSMGTPGPTEGRRSKTALLYFVSPHHSRYCSSATLVPPKYGAPATRWNAQVAHGGRMTVEWSPNMSVGVERFDQQHRRWIDLMNELFRALREHRGNAALETTLREVTEYTETHFREEEAALSSAHYPQYSEHKAQHEAFVADLRAIRDAHAAGTALLSVVVAKKLTDWLFQHISGTDQAYAAHLARGAD